MRSPGKSGWTYLAALAILTAPAAQAQDREVGRVKDYRGKAADFRLLRQGAPLRFQHLLPLRENDVLEVKPGQAAILVLNGKELCVCGDPAKPPQGYPKCDAGPRYTIPRTPSNPKSDPGPFVGFFQALGSWLTSAEEEQERVTNADVPRPGETIDLPLLPAGGISSASIADGRRTFQLPWQGCRPASFGLYRGDHTEKDQDPVIALTGQTGAAAHQENVTLYPGTYHVVVTCDTDKNVSVRRDITVVRARELPAIPDFSAAALPSDLLRVTRAAWLAANSNSSWFLEAYLEVADLPDTFGPAHDLRTALARGRVPPAK